MDNTYRNYANEQHVMELLQKYMKYSISITFEMMGLSKKMYHNLIDSRVIPRRGNVITVIVELQFSREDAIDLMGSQGYIFPFGKFDEDILEKLGSSS